MKLTLDNKDLTDGFFEETKLLGIMAPIKDYLFCWQVNQLMGVDFRINNELEIQLKKKGRTYFFSGLRILTAVYLPHALPVQQPARWRISFAGVQAPRFFMAVER
jgi:hypothetical protein